MPSKMFYQKSKVAVASGFESGVCRSKENCPPCELTESAKSLAFGSYVFLNMLFTCMACLLRLITYLAS